MLLDKREMNAVEVDRISVGAKTDISRGVKSGHYAYFILDGSLRVKSHNAETKISSGNILWVGAGVDRRIATAGPATWIILRIRNRLFAPGNGADQVAWRTLIQAGRLNQASARLPVTRPSREALFETVHQLLEAIHQGKAPSLPGLKGQVFRMLGIMETDKQFISHARMDTHQDPWAEHLQKVLLVIDEEISSIRDVTQLAERCGFSRSALYRTLEASGLPAPGVLLEQSRLDQAIRLLRSSDQTILSIAMDTGFGSMSAMYRSFERKHGQPPGAFRGN